MWNVFMVCISMLRDVISIILSLAFYCHHTIHFKLFLLVNINLIVFKTINLTQIIALIHYLFIVKLEWIFNQNKLILYCKVGFITIWWIWVDNRSPELKIHGQEYCITWLQQLNKSCISKLFNIIEIRRYMFFTITLNVLYRNRLRNVC